MSHLLTRTFLSSTNRLTWPSVQSSTSKLRYSTSGEALRCLTAEEKMHFREIPEEIPELSAAAPSDFYQLLSLELGATNDQIRDAYKSILKITHPDIVGPAANELTVLLNKACELLLDDERRASYDAEVRDFRQRRGVGFDGRPVSIWAGTNEETRAVFIDETQCIGCRNCTMCAPSTFIMEDLWGRARVACQWGDEEEYISEAVSSCPVDCIYFVKRSQLALLEYVMKNCEREDIAIMARRRSGNMGLAPASENPFQQAETFLKLRKDVDVRHVGKTLANELVQDEHLGAAIAKAWLQLPKHVRSQAWNSFVSEDEQ